MNLPDLKQLEKIIALCRKRGVKSIKIDNVELTLSEDAPESNYKRKVAKAAEPFQYASTPFETDTLTEDQLLMWSVGSDPTAEKTE